MHNCQDESLINRWFPVAGATELPKRHVFHGQLLGEELALWRSDDGTVNAWENRCPHRGVRLSIGLNLGSELKCQYHGMQFATGSGQCTFMPAHRDMPPARALCVKTYSCIEQDGFIWVTLGKAAAPGATLFSTGPATPLRSLPFNVSALVVADALTHHNDQVIARVQPIDAFSLAAYGPHPAVFALQPVDHDRCILHGAILSAVGAEDRVAILHAFSDSMSELRRAVESAGTRLLAPERSKSESAYRRLIDGQVRYGMAA
jgi:nitrite reductase/ring-hydroxylating ferredoxin subunit